MKKILFIIGVLIVITLSAFTLTNQTQKSKQESEKIKIITTLFPVYDMAKNIGGDKAEVYLLLPPGIEAHSFEPKPSTLIKINNAALFIYTSRFMEPWAEDIIKTVTNKNLIIIDSNVGTKIIPIVFNNTDESAESLIDPHIWLDFDNAQTMAQNIKQGFIAKDSNNKNFYEQKTAHYLNKLTELDSKYRAVLSSCKHKKIIYAGHYAFGYLANRYDLKYTAAQAVSPNSEPTANDLVNLINQINKDDIKYIFYEELTSPKIAETIVKETNVKMLILNAAHNLSKNQFEQNISFFDILNANLENLKIGLECQ